MCFLTVTTLVIPSCYYDTGFTIELDVPRVRYFRYNGKVDVFPLKSPLPVLRRADFHIFGRQDCTLFWSFLTNFRNTKAQKLNLNYPVKDIAVAEKNRHDELLDEMWFGNLERLEVDVKYDHATKDDATVEIGNLLQCCPALGDLRLKLSIVDEQPYRRKLLSSRYKRALLNRKAQSDFRKSICHQCSCRNEK